MIDNELRAVTVIRPNHFWGDFCRLCKGMMIGHKLVLIYILGIFLPLLIANGLILRSVLAEASEREHELMLSKVYGLMDSISREFEPVVDVTDFVYTDGVISRTLSGPFPDFSDFLLVYKEFLAGAINKYVSVFPGISRMIVYIENMTVGVSGVYMSIDSHIRSSSWFENPMFRELGMLTLYHVDKDIRMEIRERSYISLFRELDNPALSRPGRMILRIDINPVMLRRHLQSMEYEGHIRLVDPLGNVAIELSKGDGPESIFTFKRSFSETRSLKGWQLEGEFTRRIEKDNWPSRWTILLGVSGLSIAVSSLFVLFLSRSITSRLARLSLQMKKVKQEDFSTIEIPENSHDEVGQLIADYNIMAEKIGNLINDGYKLEIERGRLLLARRQAELKALQSQVNPHFLYNVLESIRMKSHIKGEHDTAQIIKKLSRIFRRMMSWDEDLVSIDDELTFTREYLDIQKYRFEDRIGFDIINDCGENILRIPKMTIQALVENACVHGIEKKAEGGAVSVHVESSDGLFVITVSDNGAGCDEDAARKIMFDNRIDSRHTGLANVYRRLKLHFGSNVTLDFASTSETGTKVRICIGREDEHNTDNDS